MCHAFPCVSILQIHGKPSSHTCACLFLGYCHASCLLSDLSPCSANQTQNSWWPAETRLKITLKFCLKDFLTCVLFANMPQTCQQYAMNCFGQICIESILRYEPRIQGLDVNELIWDGISCDKASNKWRNSEAGIWYLLSIPLVRGIVQESVLNMHYRTCLYACRQGCQTVTKDQAVRMTKHIVSDFDSSGFRTQILEGKNWGSRYKTAYFWIAKYFYKFMHRESVGKHLKCLRPAESSLSFSVTQDSLKKRPLGRDTRIHPDHALI